MATIRTWMQRRAVAEHPVFSRFTNFQGHSEPGFERWHYGVNLRDWLFTGTSKGNTTRRAVAIGVPVRDEEYFEWIALLTAVSEAADVFRMAELGAGWGRWMVAGAALCRQRDTPFSLIGVEAEPSHFEWMNMVLRDNDIDPAQQTLICAAVTAVDGPAYLAGPDRPLEVWGCRAVSDGEREAYERLPDYVCRPVMGVSLASLLRSQPSIDLIDLDIQGSEYEVLASAIDELTAKVKLVHVGTHSRQIESQLRELFRSRSWLAGFDFAGEGERRTPFGRVRFTDGVQSWVNVRWAHLRDVLLGRSR